MQSDRTWLRVLYTTHQQSSPTDTLRSPLLLPTLLRRLRPNPSCFLQQFARPSAKSNSSSQKASASTGEMLPPASPSLVTPLLPTPLYKTGYVWYVLSCERAPIPTALLHARGGGQRRRHRKRWRRRNGWRMARLRFRSLRAPSLVTGKERR